MIHNFYKNKPLILGKNPILEVYFVHITYFSKLCFNNIIYDKIVLKNKVRKDI